MEYVENKEVEEEQTRGIFRDMAKYAPSKIVGMLGNALIVPVYTSLLPPEQYGLYSISIALLSFLCILFSDWVGLSGLRFFRHHQLMQDMPKYLTTLVSILTFIPSSLRPFPAGRMISISGIKEPPDNKSPNAAEASTV